MPFVEIRFICSARDSFGLFCIGLCTGCDSGDGECEQGFPASGGTFTESFVAWCNQHRSRLYELKPGHAPKRLIEELSSSLLEIFKQDRSLVDAYDVYDCLMNYWSETMQDDCYLIASDGWKAELYTPQPMTKSKDNKVKKAKKAATPEDVVCDLLPVPIVIDEYFPEMKSCILAAEEVLNDNETKLSELLDEHEDYFDTDNFADKKLNDTNVKKRIKTLDKVKDAEELDTLNQYLQYKEDITVTKRLIRELKYKLLSALLVRYADFTEDEIKRLVIEKKCSLRFRRVWTARCSVSSNS